MCPPLSLGFEGGVSAPRRKKNRGRDKPENGAIWRQDITILGNEKYMHIWHHFRKIQVFELKSEVEKMQKMKFFRHFAPPLRCHGNQNLG